MKYLLYSAMDYPEAYGDMPISGLFHWRRIFNGEMGIPPKDALCDYDIIHINLTGNSTNLPAKIRKIIQWGNKPKLVINVDYALQMWAGNFADAEVLIDALDYADFVFHVEESAAESLSMTMGRKVHFIPHPVDVDYLRRFSTSERDPAILGIIHRYDRQWLGPWLAGRKQGMKLTGCYIQAASDPQVMASIMTNFDGNMPFSNYANFIPRLARAYLAIESYVLNSYGRVSVECAALGVPCVGANVVGSIKHCFPDLATQVMDYQAQRKLVYELVHDHDFWRACVEKGQELSNFYGYAQSRERMLSALEEEGVYQAKPEDWAIPDPVQEIPAQQGGIAL